MEHLYLPQALAQRASYIEALRTRAEERLNDMRARLSSWLATATFPADLDTAARQAVSAWASVPMTSLALLWRTHPGFRSDWHEEIEQWRRVEKREHIEVTNLQRKDGRPAQAALSVRSQASRGALRIDRTHRTADVEAPRNLASPRRDLRARRMACTRSARRPALTSLTRTTRERNSQRMRARPLGSRDMDPPNSALVSASVSFQLTHNRSVTREHRSIGGARAEIILNESYNSHSNVRTSEFAARKVSHATVAGTQAATLPRGKKLRSVCLLFATAEDA